MKYNITEQSITIVEGNLRKIINIDENMAEHEATLIKMILVDKKSYQDVCSFVDGIMQKKVVEVVKADKELSTKEKLQTVNISEDEIQDFSKGQIKISDNQLFWRGEKVNNKKLIDFIAHYRGIGADISFIERFMEKLYSNPDQKARDDIFDFIVNRCGIMDDGDFIAYKRVKANYKDCHSGTMDNSIGKTVSMDRKKCDSNPNQTCSAGLHVCTKGYLSSFGGDRVVLCKVNPKDVVAIPRDYNSMKMRTCEYKVIGEVKDQKDFVDIIERLYKDPTDKSAFKDHINETKTSEAIIKNTDITKKVVVEVEDIVPTLKEIFSNDSKVLASFKAGEKVIEAQTYESDIARALALESELLTRALKLRPGNAKLKAAIQEWEERRNDVKEPEPEEVTKTELLQKMVGIKTEAGDNNCETIIEDPKSVSVEVTYLDLQVEKNLTQIFSTDSKVMASFKAGKNRIDAMEFPTPEEKQKALDKELLERACKLRPKNTRMAEFALQCSENYKVHEEKMKRKSTELNENCEPKTKTVSEVVTPEVAKPATTDVKAIQELVELFSTDSKVQSALNKVQEEEGKSLYQSMIDRIKKVRPDSAKLRKFLEGK